MDIAPTAWSIVSAVLMFILGGFLSTKSSRVFDTSSKRALALYLWHTSFSLVYLSYVMNYGGDAASYYETSSQGGIAFSTGTAAIQFIAMFFSSVLGMSVLGVFLSFNLFGFIGLLAFDTALQFAVSNKGRQIRGFATLVVFLPSVSFWSSALGKDSVSFMAAGLTLWAALNLNKRALLMTLAIGLMFLVRPHIAALMVVALALSVLIQSRVSIVQRGLIGGAAVAAAATIVPFAMDYSGLGSNAGAPDLAAYIEVRQVQNMQGGGGIDIASMSLPMQMFSYLFRPLPFDAKGIPGLAASMDNIVLLLLAVAGGSSMIRRRRPSGTENRAFLWIFSLSTWLVLALTTANLGIALRQKWVFAPMLIFLFISVIGRARNPVTRTAEKSRMSLEA